MAPLKLFMLSLVLLLSFLTLPHVANSEDDYFVVGDLSQYTTNGVRTYPFISQVLGLQNWPSMESNASLGPDTCPHGVCD